MHRKRLLGLFVAAGVMLAGVSSAQAAIEIEKFETTSSNTQAGGHPDLRTVFSLADPGAPEAAKNVIFYAPEGLFGNPNALSRCSASDFALDQCPVNSQAGTVTVRASYEGNPEYILGTAPLFDLEPQENQTALFAFIAPTVNVPITIPVQVQSGSDYSLRFSVSEITELIPLKEADLTWWGSPSLKVHNSRRFPIGSPGKPAGCPGLPSTECLAVPSPSSIAVQPLIDNPTVCTGESLTSTLEVESYQDSSKRSVAQAEYPAVTGCEHEVFNPALRATLTTEDVDSASGLNLGFDVPQTLGETPSPSEAKAVKVVFPAGLNINPDAADGQSSCTDAQAAFGSNGPSSCPDKAKIGTVTIGTPALDGPLAGSIYIGEPKPANQYRLFLILSGFGINAKLVGSVQPDPQTGQVTVEFADLPQVPFAKFDIHLFASDRGLMATPNFCTTYVVNATFVPWNDLLANQRSEALFGLRSGPNGTLCPGQVRPFHPRLVAGSSNPAAGAFSPFHLKLERDDGDQFLDGLNFTMPPGLTGSLAGRSYCPDSAIVAASQNSGRAEEASPSCPAGSEIGTTNVSAGPGSHPFHAVGKMYLGGPVSGAPLSVVAVTPALAGPYDYGVVVVRVAIHIDPLDAHVVADSEPMPKIIGGIPIRMRSIQVNIDKPNFTINPTNCSHFSVESQGIGDQGTVTDFSSYFHAVNCRSLAFAPKMTVRVLGGRRGTHRASNPRLRLDLRTRSGDANIKSISVTLSNAFEIDQRHLGNICSEKELAEKQCAGRTPIGKATTETPLLDQPLSGPVYAVSGSGGLPRLAFILSGQVDLVPRADTETIGGGRLKTMVPVVPDAPIGHFHLTVFGGKAGYLINTRDLCTHAPVTRIAYTGQNGKARTEAVKVKTACGGKARAKQHRG
jgi:hypothetical protein